ncbi:MAG: hypothetical protein RR806_09180 [Oscillospiraceae bacterium]
MKRKYTQEEVWQHMSGRIYCNSKDTNIFVRRKGISSWTMNLGNAWSWVIMGIQLIVIVTILLFLL